MRFFNSLLNILRFNRKNWRAVVLCVFAATIFWFFNSLNKTYTTNIDYPVRFDYDQANYVPVTALPREVRINVTGSGWDLFKRSTGLKATALDIPLGRPAEIKKIANATLYRIFSNQVDGVEINFVLTDTLYVDVEPRAGRWINLAMDSIQGNLKKGYGLASNVTLDPDSVFIEGPLRLISAFHEPVQLKLRQRNIDEDFNEDVELDIPSSQVIKRDPPTVAVTFAVERMVNISDSVLVTAVNVPSTVSTVEKRYIPITVAIPESKVSQFSVDSVHAVLDLRNFRKGEAKVLPDVTGLPPHAVVVKIDTVRIRL
jgi:hypothetical protein